MLDVLRKLWIASAVSNKQEQGQQNINTKYFYPKHWSDAPKDIYATRKF